MKCAYCAREFKGSSIICDNCQVELGFMIDTDDPEMDETFEEHMNRLIDRVADGLTPIDDNDETYLEEDEEC